MLPTVLESKAIEVVDELQTWLENYRDQLGDETPVANVIMSVYTLDVAIDDVPVWGSEVDDAEALNFDELRNRYRQAVRSLAMVLDDPTTERAT